MSTAALPARDHTPSPAPPEIGLTNFNQECAALRTQLANLAQRLQDLESAARRLQPDDRPQSRASDGPSLEELIDALVRRADDPPGNQPAQPQRHYFRSLRLAGWPWFLAILLVGLGAVLTAQLLK
jgi:hypothetical protein